MRDDYWYIWAAAGFAVGFFTCALLVAVTNDSHVERTALCASASPPAVLVADTLCVRADSAWRVRP